MEIFAGFCAIILAIALNVDKSNVVLLDAGKPSAIVIKSKNDIQTINQTNASVLVGNNISKIKILSQDELDKKYSKLLNITTKPPVSYILYFTNGSNLDSTSQAKIPEILETISKREPCAISVIGHSDTYGSQDLNIKVSLQRANKVAKILESKGAKIVDMKITSFGERDLLVKTGDNVVEYKNRRVEIQIR